jgi:hypothetical protein
MGNQLKECRHEMNNIRKMLIILSKLSIKLKHKNPNFTKQIRILTLSAVFSYSFIWKNNVALDFL